MVALTGLALAARRPAAARLGLAFTATVAAFALPRQASWWLLPGVLRVRSGGLLSGWITHILAGGLIFLFILHAATQAHWPAG